MTDKPKDTKEQTAITAQSDAQMLENVLLQGDLSKLTPAQRVSYYKKVCDSLGLNPLTRPFDYITLNNRLTLYAKKDAADQLRTLHGVSIDDVEINETPTQFIVKAKGHNQNGRTDVEVGVVSKEDMHGNLANAQMKAVTKAKRRLTLSLCSLGWLDETETANIPNATPVVIGDGGEVNPIPMTYEEAAAIEIEDKDKNLVRLDRLDQPRLEYLVEHNKDSMKVRAAEIVLEHDFGMTKSTQEA